MGRMKYFGELGGRRKIVKGSQGGQSKYFGYSTSNMHINTIAQLHSWGGGVMKIVHTF